MKDSTNESGCSRYDFVDALRSEIDDSSDEQTEELNGLLARMCERCGPQQPLLGAICQALAYDFLERDRSSRVLFEQFTGEEITNLAERCGHAGGMFAMQDKLSAAIQALMEESRDDECQVCDREWAQRLVRRTVALSGGEREALCDMLLLLQANDELTVDKLRANLTVQNPLVVSPNVRR